MCAQNCSHQNKMLKCCYHFPIRFKAWVQYLQQSIVRGPHSLSDIINEKEISTINWTPILGLLQLHDGDRASCPCTTIISQATIPALSTFNTFRIQDTRLKMADERTNWICRTNPRVLPLLTGHKICHISSTRTKAHDKTPLCCRGIHEFQIRIPHYQI